MIPVYTTNHLSIKPLSIWAQEVPEEMCSSCLRTVTIIHLPDLHCKGIDTGHLNLTLILDSERRTLSPSPSHVCATTVLHWGSWEERLVGCINVMENPTIWGRVESR